MTDFENFEDPYRRGRPEIDGAHRRQRVDQIIRSHGDKLFLPPELDAAEEERKRKAREAEQIHHDVVFAIDHDPKATARRLGFTVGDERTD